MNALFSPVFISLLAILLSACVPRAEPIESGVGEGVYVSLVPECSAVYVHRGLNVKPLYD